MRTLTIRLDDHTDVVLRTLCTRAGLTRTEVVRAGIEELARKTPASPGELAEALGLVGSFASGEGDLGRNHSLHIREKLREKLARRKADE